jgi:uncharacterized membrane protein
VKGIGASLATGLIIVLVIFLFVRPGSNGVNLVTGVGTALQNVITASTGGGTWSGK